MKSQFSPDDPKLTAYALGELDAAQAALINARLRADPEARQVVEEIRATVGQLEAALAAEHGDPVATGLDALMAKRESRVIDLPYARRRRGWAQVLGFPQSYFLISGAAAAIFVGMVLVGTPRFERSDRTMLQLAAEQRARAISEARYDALREQFRRERRLVSEVAVTAGGKATPSFRPLKAAPGVQFVVPIPSPGSPRPEPMSVADLRHLTTGPGLAGTSAAHVATADLSLDLGKEEGGDDLVRMDPLLVEDDAMRDLARNGLLYQFTIASVLDWARSSMAADDPGGLRREYINVLRRSDGG